MNSAPNNAHLSITFYLKPLHSLDLQNYYWNAASELNIQHYHHYYYY